MRHVLYIHFIIGKYDFQMFIEAVLQCLMRATEYSEHHQDGRIRMPILSPNV